MGKMENGKWKMENGKWKMEKWKVTQTNEQKYLLLTMSYCSTISPHSTSTPP
jgi:hypothetical protein